MNAIYEYNIGMKNRQSIQYTIRNLPRLLDEKLRARSKELDQSLNEVAVEALKRGVGLSEEPIVSHDLDPLAGSWKDDPVCEEALRLQDTIDDELW